MIGRRDFTRRQGRGASRCARAIAGGVSWNAGSYNPKTGLYYKLGNEWCMTLEVTKTTPIVEPQVQLNIGADFKIVAPPAARSMAISTRVIRSRAPRSGRSASPSRRSPACCRPEATSSSCRTARGTVHAYDADSGTELWNHGDGTGHQGGIISYAVNGKQYIAVVAGFGGMASDDYAPTFGGVYKSMPRDDGALVVYSLK